VATKKGNTGKRYTDEQKKAILAFVESQGRGGISAATRKFGVSYIALRRWMGGGTRTKGKGRGRVGRPPKAKGIDGRSQRKVKTALKAAKELLKQATLLRRLLKGLAK
jgi:transposase-like protein